MTKSKKARLAQSVEHETLNLRVVGSSCWATNIFYFFHAALLFIASADHKYILFELGT